MFGRAEHDLTGDMPLGHRTICEDIRAFSKYRSSPGIQPTLQRELVDSSTMFQVEISSSDERVKDRPTGPRFSEVGKECQVEVMRLRLAKIRPEDLH